MTDNKFKLHLIGRYGDLHSGPVLICMGGIHGNETEGIKAIENISEKIRQNNPNSFHGEFIGLRGNLSALEAGVRFIDRDLNRKWEPNRISQILFGNVSNMDTEDKEMMELYFLLKEILQSVKGRKIYFLDLHTSTASGSPFICIGDTLQNRKFASQFPIPIILGLEEHLENPLLEYMNSLGCVSLGIEGGKHNEPTSIEYLESAIWLSLSTLKMTGKNSHNEKKYHFEKLKNANNNLPQFIEIKHRHKIDVEDGFTMKLGYENFQHIFPGEEIAKDKKGTIKANISGRIILPLYQGIGNDGFFVGIEIHTFWLKLSAIIRRFRFDILIPFLPGIKRHLDLNNTLIVNKKMVRWCSVDIFHLFGYRKIRETENNYLISKRLHGNSNFD